MKKIKIGDVNLTYSNMGLDFNTSNNSVWLNMLGVDKLKEFLLKNDEDYKKYLLNKNRTEKLEQLNKNKLW